MLLAVRVADTVPEGDMSLKPLSDNLTATVDVRIYGAAVPEDWDAGSQDNFRKRVLEPLPAATGLSDFAGTI